MHTLMVILGLGLSYLGTLLWYAASPQTDGLLEEVPGGRIGPFVLRALGTGLLMTGTAGLAVELGGGPGLLVALCTVMGTASLLVIAAPLWPRFLRGSGIGALLLTVILPWLL